MALDVLDQADRAFRRAQRLAARFATGGRTGHGVARCAGDDRHRGTRRGGRRPIHAGRVAGHRYARRARPFRFRSSPTIEPPGRVASTWSSSRCSASGMPAVQVCLHELPGGVPARRASRWSLVASGLVLTVATAAGVIGRIIWGASRIGALAPRRALSLIGLLARVCAAIALVYATPAWPAWIVLTVAALFGGTAIGWNGVQLSELARLAPAGSAGASHRGIGVRHVWGCRRRTAPLRGVGRVDRWLPYGLLGLAASQLVDVRLPCIFGPGSLDSLNFARLRIWK